MWVERVSRRFQQSWALPTAQAPNPLGTEELWVHTLVLMKL